MNKLSLGLLIGFACAGLACQPAGQKVSDNGAAPQTHQTGQTATGQTGPSLDQIPASLKNDAFSYYALNYNDPITYQVTTSQGGSTQPTGIGTQQIKFTGMQNGKATFDVERTGALEAYGSEQVSLTDQGVYVESISLGKLTGHPLDMPATLKPGQTWSNDFGIEAPQGTERDHATYKIVGPQKVKTKAGAFDTILIQENDVITDPKGAKTPATAQAWYAKGRGIVKANLTSGTGATAQSISWEAVPGAPE